MSDCTKIEWTEATWSPVTGCTKISDGCLNCYIERTPPFRMEHRRFNLPVIGGTTGVKLHSDRLGIPLRWRKPRRIFVCSLADLFHEQVPTKFIAEVFAVMSLAPQHTFQVLTKRHARMRSLLSSPGFRPMVDAARVARGFLPLPSDGPVVLPGVWLGVSVESQEWADIRIPVLLDTPAAVRWLSMEPLLGPVSLSRWLDCDCPAIGNPAFCHHPGCPIREGRAIDWVVVGGESGPGARPMHPDWARRLRGQCVRAAVPFFFKQWGEWAPIQDPFDYVTDDDRCQVLHISGQLAGRPWRGWAQQAGHEESEAMRRYGKKRAGRDLDGRLWEQYPTTQVGAVT